ncbi:MAG TPA: anhydro-N-acetylmuramic acid kinase [Candidatus Baltobacteraceae bacterium]|jgi:anhydro-N-acetylmuramic acid kinase|nr:anhydro-N-acetylmuramic acid kinase [Candidatus Baltobacteraceae bacterium]
MLALGLMSGTSLDGIDAALVQIEPAGESYALELIDFEIIPFDDVLLRDLHGLLPPNAGNVADIARTHHALGAAYADAAVRLARGRTVDYVACHGQTVWHDGGAHVTLQIGDAFMIRERLDATVCYDFRSADCAAGGHGAPLVPYVDALLLGSALEDRVAINIGGIANLTVIPRTARPADVLAFDSGPGNMLIDALIRERTAGAVTFDEGGKLALAGTADQQLLKAMASHPYFSLPPPKTAGREQFGSQFLHPHAQALSALRMEDAAATLAELTAATIAQAVRLAAPGGSHVLVSGGGVRNAAIFSSLQARLGGMRVEPSSSVALNPDAKEAIAFAVLGYETLRGRPANVPGVTGASHPAVLGAIAPSRLPELLEKVRSECRAS